MSEWGRPTAADEWVGRTLAGATSWSLPMCMRSRNFAQLPKPRPGKPAIWLEDTRGEDGTPLTGQRREYRG